MTHPRLFIITGVMAAGKSTIAEAIAQRIPRSVHLRGDIFRRMIINGRADMSSEPSAEAVSQLELRYALAATAVSGYLRAGFTVIYQDVILGEYLPKVVERLQAESPHVVVLNPEPEAIAARERGRAKTGYVSFTPETLYEVLHTQTPRIGYWLDTSRLSVDETVTTILSELEASRVYQA